jgi:hypothetical protein
VNEKQDFEFESSVQDTDLEKKKKLFWKERSGYYEFSMEHQIKILKTDMRFGD